MRKYNAVCLLILALVLLCSSIAHAASGFDHELFRKDDMFSLEGTNYLYGDDYMYSYSANESGWLCGLMTMGEPYLMFFVQGDSDGEEVMIQIQAAFDLANNTASASVIEFVTEDLIHRLELTEAAQKQGLEGFPIYKANYNVIKALASSAAFSVRAYIEGQTYEIAMEEDACELIRQTAEILVSQNVLSHYSSDFSGESAVQQMNNLLSYTIDTADNRDSTITPQHVYTPKITTIGEKNALKQAKLYLDVMPFSYKGLIEQLEYEGYSYSEAVYGADNCGADWYHQAAKSAANYLEIMPFSRSGLIDQLEYDGYTYDQAVYGVEKNGY